MQPPLKHSFEQIFQAVKSQPGNTVRNLETTGKGILFDATAKITRDGREFIALPHNNRIYEGDWGYSHNSMGKDGQWIGQYARPLDEWCGKHG
jgi:hypothetical protein